jgi:uncharacterized protein YjbI with pentapeptide repeats
MSDANDPRELTVPEQRVLAAVRAGETCDFTGETEWDSLSFTEKAKVVHERITSGPPPEVPWCDRRIGSDFLRLLMLNEYPGVEVTLLDLRGAVVDGAVSLNQASIPSIVLRNCWLPQVDFGRATFTGSVEFGNSIFEGDAYFEAATFTESAWFWGAIFTGDASFLNAQFRDTAYFDDATVDQYASFADATFVDSAHFGGITIRGTAGFEGATFCKGAYFSGAVANKWQLDRARFESTDPGPWCGREVSLAQAVSTVRSRIKVSATTTVMCGFQAVGGVHLMISGETVDLSDAEFFRRSIVAGGEGRVAARTLPPKSDLEELTDELQSPQPVIGESFEQYQQRIDEWWRRRQDKERRDLRTAALLFRHQFTDKLREESQRWQSTVRLRSMARADVAELVISGLAMDDCVFAGAHGLDKMRLEKGCTYASTPRWTWRHPFTPPYTRRQVIAEEVRWRQRNARGWGRTDHDADVVSAIDIAGIYRDLRKGLEDNKNEPGAADFYYGEMEMRRLAHREPHERSLTTRVEDILLWLYWAVAGYGLRASRALATLAIVLTVSATLYTHRAFAVYTSAVDLGYGVTIRTARPLDSLSFADALEFAARESISVLQSRSSAVTLTHAGAILDFLLRLLGPVLLGLAVLAIRGRMKR